MPGFFESLHGEAKGKDVRERLVRQIGLWGAPIELGRTTLVQDLRVVTVACAPLVLKRLNIRKATAEYLADMTSDETVGKAVLEIVRPSKADIPARAGRPPVSRFAPTTFAGGVIGTHIPKATDATVELSIVSDIGPTRDGEIPFLSGAIPSARRRFGSGTSNPAGDAKKIRFLGLPVSFEGRTMPMGEWLANGRDIADALELVGWPRIWLDMTAKAIGEGLHGLERVESVPHNLKTIYFPMPGGGYVQLSPLTSAAQWSETHARIRRFAVDGQAPAAPPDVFRSYRSTRRRIGGSNAQNISFETPMLGNGFDLLGSMPPPARLPSNLARLIHRVKKSGSALGNARLPSVLAGLLSAHVAPDVRRNMQWEDRFARLLASAAEVHLSGALALAQAIAAGQDPSCADPIADPAERTFVIDGFHGLDDAGRDAIVDGFAEFLTSGPTGVPWLAGDHVRKDLLLAIAAADGDGAPVRKAANDDGSGAARPAPVTRAPAHIRTAKGRGR
jgi:hypothetical protein